MKVVRKMRRAVRTKLQFQTDLSNKHRDFIDDFIRVGNFEFFLELFSNKMIYQLIQTSICPAWRRVLTTEPPADRVVSDPVSEGRDECEYAGQPGSCRRKYFKSLSELVCTFKGRITAHVVGGYTKQLIEPEIMIRFSADSHLDGP